MYVECTVWNLRHGTFLVPRIFRWLLVWKGSAPLKQDTRIQTTFMGRESDSLRAGRSGDQIPVGGEIFRIRPNRPWGPPSLLYNGYRVLPGGKAVGAWCWPPTPSSAEVKERVELYICSPSGPPCPVLGWTYKLRLEGYKMNEALHCKILNDSGVDENDQNVFLGVPGVRTLNQLTQ